MERKNTKTTYAHVFNFILSKYHFISSQNINTVPDTKIHENKTKNVFNHQFHKCSNDIRNQLIKYGTALIKNHKKIIFKYCFNFFWKFDSSMRCCFLYLWINI